MLVLERVGDSTGGDGRAWADHDARSPKKSPTGVRSALLSLISSSALNGVMPFSRRDIAMSDTLSTDAISARDTRLSAAMPRILSATSELVFIVMRETLAHSEAKWGNFHGLRVSYNDLWAKSYTGWRKANAIR